VLIEHMTAQHHAFAAAAGSSRSAAEPVAAGEAPAATAEFPRDESAPSIQDVVGRYEESARTVIAAFADVNSLDRPFWLAEFGRAVPGRLAVGFHLVDYVVHGWDVARAIGAAYQPDAEVLALTRPIARAVPDGPERLEAGAAFAPALPVTAGIDPLGEILRLLGRDPAYPGPTSR
jgi:uncharacterized protein (TIGR03086 family)